MVAIIVYIGLKPHSKIVHYSPRYPSWNVYDFVSDSSFEFIGCPRFASWWQN